MRLTSDDTYQAILRFLESEYADSKSDDLAGLLGAMQFKQEGETMDPAIMHDWINLSERRDLTVSDARLLAAEFLSKYGNLMNSKDLCDIAGSLLDGSKNMERRHKWDSAINSIVEGKS